MIYISTINIDLRNKVHPLKKTQIAYLRADKAPTKVFSKYIDLAEIFLPKLAIKLFKYIKINN